MISKTLVGHHVRVVFSISAYEGEESVCLVGDFNDWRTDAAPMQKTPDGNWQIALDLDINQRYQYRYLINETTWHNDPDADGFVRDEGGQANSVVSTAVVPADVQSSMKRTTPVRDEDGRYRRVLIPFTDCQLIDSAMMPAMEIVRRLGDQIAADSPEIILLRIRPAQICPYEQERVYSELRGVQARMHSYPLSSRIDTVSGLTVQSIVEYAGRNAVDLIVMPNSEELSAAEDGRDQNLARQVAHAAPCDTLIVE